jgi:release factor glutamine methyltransferase
MNLVLLASPAALVPRRETEVIGYASLEKARKVPAERPLVVDLCTGAGNLALAIAKHCPRARVYGSDLSPEAVSLARENARFVGCNEVEFRCGDLLEPFKEPAFIGAVDVLICNPPYISTARVATMPMEISRHEPRLAFDGGPFGVNLLRRLIAGAPLLLKPGGSLLFEVGHGQGDHAAKLVEREQTLSQVERLRDSNGIVRVIAAARTIRLGSEHA